MIPGPLSNLSPYARAVVSGPLSLELIEAHMADLNEFTVLFHLDRITEPDSWSSRSLDQFPQWVPADDGGRVETLIVGHGTWRIPGDDDCSAELDPTTSIAFPRPRGLPVNWLPVSAVRCI